MRLVRQLIFAVACLFSTLPAIAQDAAKSITLIVGYGPGGGYDAYARIIARHLPRFLSGNPNITVQNMPGASSLRAANYLFNAAAKDGSVIGTFSRDIAVLGLLEQNKQIQYDPLRFTWLGSASTYKDDAYMLWVRREALFKVEINKGKNSSSELVMGVTNEGGGGNDVAIFLRDALKLNAKIVAGYPDSNSIFLAMQRAEIDARLVGLSAVRTSQPEWVRHDSNMIPILQLGRSDRHPDFPLVPMARDLITDQEALHLLEFLELPFAFSKPFVAPPGLPKEKAHELRDGFMRALADQTTQGDFARVHADLSPLDGERLLEILSKVAGSTSAVKEKARAMLSQK
jgi:hypothetical protein